MLYSEQMKQICEKLGVNPDECKDGLYSTLLQTICDACDGGGGGGAVVSNADYVDYVTTLSAIENLTISYPYARSAVSGALLGCSSLKSIDLPSVEVIGMDAFHGCANLSALILRTTETVCELNVTAVLGTKIVTEEGAPTGEGFIYVPTALYEYYVELIAYQAGQLTGDAATAEYIARAVLRKSEDYPEICG